LAASARGSAARPRSSPPAGRLRVIAQLKHRSPSAAGIQLHPASARSAQRAGASSGNVCSSRAGQSNASVEPQRTQCTLSNVASRPQWPQAKARTG
jgi:hypothetical protein